MKLASQYDWKWEQLKKWAKDLPQFQDISKEDIFEKLYELELQNKTHIQNLTDQCIECHTSITQCGCSWSKRYFSECAQLT